MPPPSLLLLIPAYNEESRIAPVLREFATYFRDHYAAPFHLVVVLNGCRDNTLGVVEEVAREFPTVRALNFPDPIGKGGAIIEGLRLAAEAHVVTDLVGYVDADGATSPKTLHELARMVTGDIDCVIGSRWLPGAVLHQSQTRLRRFVSRCFHAIVECLFWMHIADTQCPGKVMRRTAVERIHKDLRLSDLSFDVNLLYALKRAGFRIKEVPIEWTDKAGSKVTQTLLRSSLVMLLSVVRLRLVHSPFYRMLLPLRPLEVWIYRKLRAPLTRPASPPRPRL
ncbi:MAG TPA: glycosyltransferase [Methylomirabilota bacterium]|nr:glycosyltransferase [Methylomirabilota bacterium]